jgi:hypothetical protein
MSTNRLYARLRPHTHTHQSAQPQHKTRIRLLGRRTVTRRAGGPIQTAQKKGAPPMPTIGDRGAQPSLLLTRDHTHAHAKSRVSCVPYKTHSSMHTQERSLRLLYRAPERTLTYKKRRLRISAKATLIDTHTCPAEFTHRTQAHAHTPKHTSTQIRNAVGAPTHKSTLRSVSCRYLGKC